MAINDQIITDRYAIYNGDCMEVMATLPDESVHLSVYSPPFATKEGGLYHYSSSERDISNSRDYDEFFDHYDFVVQEIHRLTLPGRMSAVHCMDIPTGNTGKDAMFDFPGDIIRLHTMCRNKKCKQPKRKRSIGLCGHGLFDFIARYSIWKEPLTVRNRLMIKTLAHKTIVEDSSKCSNASADYLLVFRKKGNNPIPIAHPTGFHSYAGEREIPKDVLRYKGWKGSQLENRYSHWIWRQYASAFWDDVRLDRVLPYREARDQEDEKHVHPLQLDVIERCLHLWSNPDETVLTPFMGVGSEVYMSLCLGRKGIGAELKPSYFRQARRNIEEAKLQSDDDQLGFEFSTEDVETARQDGMSFESDYSEDEEEENENDLDRWMDHAMAD
jgi:DNA modification methylase